MNLIVENNFLYQIKYRRQLQLLFYSEIHKRYLKNHTFCLQADQKKENLETVNSH